MRTRTTARSIAVTGVALLALTACGGGDEEGGDAGSNADSAEKQVNIYGTDPLEGDSDDDGLSDGEEIQVYGTEPDDPDTDDEGLNDGDEVHVYGTNPREPDTDFDRLSDYVEVTYGTNPNSAACQAVNTALPQ